MPSKASATTTTVVTRVTCSLPFQPKCLATFTPSSFHITPLYACYVFPLSSFKLSQRAFVPSVVTCFTFSYLTSCLVSKLKDLILLYLKRSYTGKGFIYIQVSSCSIIASLCSHPLDLCAISLELFP